MAISAGLAVAEMWAGLTLAYAAPALPPSFAIIAIAAGLYLGVRTSTLLRSTPVPARDEAGAIGHNQTQGRLLQPGNGPL